ncbi:MAG: hypothetical protein Q8P18_04575 [Pseudomonadota bacterium]|nr:hypothetical protein [Pseudomonadota bacterium]
MNAFRTALGSLLLATLTLVAPARADDDERQQAAESQFDALMLDNAYNPDGNSKSPARGQNRPEGAPAASPAAAYIGGGATVVTTPINSAAPAGSEVEVPLDRYEAVRARVLAADEAANRSYATLVVLGASTYSGRAVSGGLSLRLQLQATLGGPGLWKTVPLVGEEVAVVSARIGAVPLALTTQGGYQVWVTDQVGEVTLDIDLLVPARGPRGSLEYDFLVARTPVTRFDCTFPTEGLEPRLSRAVRAEVSSGAGVTRLAAWLEPTSRIRLVGFKDLGDDEARDARVYAESLNLLSVDERSADLFTVIRYNILEAGSRQFDVLVPPGLTVVSAEGEGAFRYTLDEATPEGVVLRGETAFPIRDRYEISLRLSQAFADGAGAAFTVAPPRPLDVERAYGWLGVEVIGTLKLEEVERVEALSIDAAQLPVEMVQSAVSPVLRGYRFHTPGASVRLTATRLAEREPAAGSIDQVAATTVVAAEGRAFTDLQITLRNRLRHSLALRLPEGVEARSCQLDGVPVTPSRSADGRLLLPLKRSSGDDRLEPFTLQLVLEGALGSFGPVGLESLVLPAFELPVSSLTWTVSVPANNAYTRLYGDVSPQTFAGAAAWHSPGVVLGGLGYVGLDNDNDATLPVRIELPTAGTSLRHSRYWIAADQPVAVTFGHVREWLMLPLALLGVVGLVGGAVRASGVWGFLAPVRRAGLVVAGIAGLALVDGLTGHGVTAAALLVGAVAVGRRTGAFTRLVAAVRAWWTAAAPEAPPVPGSWRAGGFFQRAGLLAVGGFVGLLALVAVIRAGLLLLAPLAG